MKQCGRRISEDGGTQYGLAKADIGALGWYEEMEIGL